MGEEKEGYKGQGEQGKEFITYGSFQFKKELHMIYPCKTYAKIFRLFISLIPLKLNLFVYREMGVLSPLDKMYADVVKFVHILFHTNDISADFTHFNITYRSVLGNGGRP